MKSLQSKLKEVQSVLVSTGGNVYHFRRPRDKKPPFIVWQEDGEGISIGADNHKAEQQIHGTIDLYTLMEFDPLADAIQDALNGADIGWSLLSVQYEDETNIIHYEWEFNAV